MGDDRAMVILAWITLAFALLFVVIGQSDAWVMFNIGTAHAWFIGAAIVRAINRGRVTINVQNPEQLQSNKYWPG